MTTIYCDIDGTLNDHPRKNGKPIQSRIDRIKQLITEGNEVILWSAGGSAGAEAFAKAHGINAKHYLTKPHIVIDDNPQIRPRGWKFFKPNEFFEPDAAKPAAPAPEGLGVGVALDMMANGMAAMTAEPGGFYIPATFKLSKLAPTKEELKFIHDWIVANKLIGGDVLEFGCGSTSWAINLAARPKNYFALEVHPGCLVSMSQHLPNIKIINTTWDDIPKIPYNIVFVDSSVGRPGGGNGIYRAEAAAYALKLAANDAVFILHDVNLGRGGYQNTIKTVLAAGLKEVARFKGHTGVGIYRR